VIQPGQHNIVIVAGNFNPTIFTQLWLVKHEVFSPEDVQANFVFTPMAVNISTQEISFLAVPDRIQLGFLNEKVNFQKLIQKTLVRIVRELHHTPFQAVGFNFAWNLSLENPKEFGKLNRKLFLSPGNPLAKYFDEEPCRFGSYLSKNVDMGRLRLDIKPILASTKDSSYECLHFAFNYNLTLKEEDKSKQIIEFLGSWDKAFSMSTEMLKTIGA